MAIGESHRGLIHDIHNMVHLGVIFSIQTEPMSGQCLVMSAQYSIHNS